MSSRLGAFSLYLDIYDSIIKKQGSTEVSSETTKTSPKTGIPIVT